MKLNIFVLFSFLVLISCSGNVEEVSMQFEVNPTGYTAAEVPVAVEINLPGGYQKLSPRDITVTLTSEADGVEVSGQIMRDEENNNRLYWILPTTSETSTTIWEATIGKKQNESEPVFEWNVTPGQHTDLTYGDRNVLRYEYEINPDYSSENNLTALNKAFHHVYDLQGENFITNGPEEGVYSHHRGIMIGWREVRTGERELSFWGMEDRTFQKHMEYEEIFGGPVVGQATSVVHWDDSSGTTLLREKRTVTAYSQPEPTITLLDFTSSLTAVNSPLELDGDAEHAGVQYRAHNDVAENAPGASEPVYYFHNETIDPREDYNLPWVGMTYGLNGKSYSVVDMNSPVNPEPTIWSAYRDYGRFGPFFRKNLDANETFTVKFRFWIRESEMSDGDVLSAKYNSFVNPPEITVITE